MDAIHGLMQGFSVAFLPINFLYCFVGVLLGTVVGVLPGLGHSGTMAIVLPLTFYFNDAGAIMLLAGIYYGSMYGGSTTSILLNIPGEAPSIVTCLDGYQMHKKGRGGAALGISAIGSFIAGTAGVIGVTFLSTVMVEWALKFGPPEYFGLVMMGVALVSYLSQGSLLKGLIMAILGMLAATVGMDPMRGGARYEFGTGYLLGGLDIIVIAMGMFALNEILQMIADPPGPGDIIKPPKRLREMLPNREEWRQSVMPIARGSIIGFLIGVIPGGGAILSTFASYAIEKKLSKHPELFGTGMIAGVAGPESANNGASAGAFVPLLSLGIPSNVPAALLLGALMIHGIAPGPMFMQTRPDVFWGVIASMYIGNVMLLLLNLPLIGLFTRIAYVPSRILIPILAFICLTVVFIMSYDRYDILVMIIFGILSLLARVAGFQVAPFIFGFLLGPILETSFERSLMISHGNFGIFVSSPIAASLLLVASLVWIAPVFSLYRRRKSRIEPAA